MVSCKEGRREVEGRRDGVEGGGIMREGREMEGTRVEGEGKAGGGGEKGG